VSITTRADPLDAMLLGENVRWETLGATSSALLDTCTEREISALVHQRLTRFERTHDWPADVCRELARRAHAAAATELVRAREIAAVLDALASHGIQPILFKGVALAYTLYDAPASRTHVDTDLLVRRNQVETIRQAMIALGYVEPPASDGELLFCQFQMVRHDRFGVDHVFDFHWKISTQSVFAGVLDYDELAADAQAVPALGSHGRAAGRVHALLLACIHPVMHHRNTERLIWTYDIHLLVSHLSDPEFDHFAALALGRRVAAICAHQLRAARARFDTKVPERVLRRLSSREVAEPSGIYLRSDRRWHHELASNVRGLGGWMDRLRLLREVLFPGARYMIATYALGPLGFVLLPGLYVHRGVYGAWKILRGRK
jgi:hypothetical protein